jgi:RimJ/RimL family protein N-acetyltransferase
MGRRRIWLDVFEHNARGRHVYEKLGYRRFDSGELDGKPLLLYEKQL